MFAEARVDCFYHNAQKMWLPGGKVVGKHQQHPEDDYWQVGLQACITDSPLCRACMEAEETPIHVMLQCNGVAEQRAAHLGSSATLHEALGDLGGLLSFWSELGWLE
ncbi:jg21119 [Pararge aegeria aegeria]|uniref:Jg21119 protein n=1 Tax=Pararge aegeria aegeria TaxID=348720 RepID=A0A8S4RQJ1_9NEOP|nr:jg21119 [Pararge aegeria aegeria]